MVLSGQRRDKQTKPGVAVKYSDDRRSETARQSLNTHIKELSMPRNASARILLSTIVGMGLAITAATARADDAGETVKRVFSSQLANVPGQTMTVLTVNYAPGAKSTQHHHAGSVFAYILSGAVRSENSATGPAKVYKAGETFFEPPGSHHLVSENASATEPASMLVVFVAEDGAVLKTIDK